MENVIISKVCGLCAGCKFAVNTALTEAQHKTNVTLFKEIVHNKNVNEMLKNNGIAFAETLEDLKNNQFVIIRAHGEPPETYEFLKNHNISYADCTCFNVKKIHEEICRHNAMGFQIAIIGKYGKFSGVMHPEIAGSAGYATNPILIEDADDLIKITNCKNNKIYVTCQTTFNEKKALTLIDQITTICKTLNKELVVQKSICSAQRAINKESAKLAQVSNVMIVVGGKNSSNTKELFENMKTITKSVFVENINDWKSIFAENNITLSSNLKVGITAGASTMTSELEQLKQNIQNEISKLEV